MNGIDETEFYALYQHLAGQNQDSAETLVPSLQMVTITRGKKNFGVSVSDGSALCAVRAVR